MSAKFVVGDILQYFRQGRLEIGLIDEITEDYVVIIWKEDQLFEYGHRLAIGLLESKYFLLLGHINGRNLGKWESLEDKDKKN